MMARYWGLRDWRRAMATVFAVGLTACGGGGGGDGGGSTSSGAPLTAIDCGANCAQDMLTAADVERIVAQTVVAAQARGQLATLAVTDRVGNVLAVYDMAAPTAAWPTPPAPPATAAAPDLPAEPSA